MAGSARWVDEANFVKPELVDRRCERAIEDEALDELRRLKQRIAPLGRLRKILVEVAEKARFAVLGQ